MTYREHIVACIKVNGQILREAGETVTLPFGSEYSILLKNLNSVRAQVSVSIDGQDVTDGRRLIIAPNSSLELERGIRNGNLAAGNRFKFIERTDAVEQHRGVGAEDGLVRVEAWREVLPAIRIHSIEPYSQSVPWRPFDHQVFLGNVSASSSGNVNTMSAGASCSTSQMTADSVERSSVLNDAGITVPGSLSNQQFTTVADFALENQSTVIVLRLRGRVGERTADQPITVKTKFVCITCGKTNEATAKFCAECGTALRLI